MDLRALRARSDASRRQISSAPAASSRCSQASPWRCAAPAAIRFPASAHELGLRRHDTVLPGRHPLGLRFCGVRPRCGGTECAAHSRLKRAPGIIGRMVRCVAQRLRRSGAGGVLRRWCCSSIAQPIVSVTRPAGGCGFAFGSPLPWSYCCCCSLLPTPSADRGRSVRDRRRRKCGGSHADRAGRVLEQLRHEGRHPLMSALGPVHVVPLIGT